MIMLNKLPTFMRGHRVASLFAGAMMSALASTTAGAFQIVPISQDFEPSGRGSNQTFQVENDRDEPITVTIAMAVRKMDADGKETLQPTEDFSVFPTEIVLQAKTARVVRTKWLGDPSPKAELSYRIIAEETPLNMRRDTPGASVFLTVRYVGSIYVVPKGAKADIAVTSSQVIPGPRGGRQVELMVENRGTKHGIIDTPSLTVSAGGVSRTIDTPALAEVLGGENILAQSRRRFLLPVSQDLPEGPVKAEFKYTLQ